MRIKAKVKDGTVWITDVRVIPQFNDQTGGHILYRIEPTGLKNFSRTVVKSPDITILEKTMELSLFTLHRKLEYEYNRKGNKRDTILPI